MKLVKTFLCTQLKQTYLENRLDFSTESPKEGFNDTTFQHFADELKHCNSNMRMDLQLLVPVFLCLYSLYLVNVLSYRMIFFHSLFCFISFPREFAILQFYVTRLVSHFKKKYFAINCLLLFYLISSRILQITFKVKMSKEKISFINKNKNNGNFCSITYFVYYK